MKSGKVLKNIGWLLIGSIARMIVQLVIGAISARYLGPENYGTLNYVAAYITLFSTICELGLTITIVNEIVNNEHEEGSYVGSAIFLRLVVSIFSIVALFLLLLFVDGNSKLIMDIALVRGIGLIFDSFNTISIWYQSKLQSKYVTLFELLAYILSAVYKVIIIVFKKNVIWFACATTIDSLLIALLLCIGYKKHSTYRLHIRKDICIRLLRLGTPFVFSGIMVYVYGQIDRIMIGKMMTQADLGFYSCASTIGTMVAFIPQAIMNSFKPIIMEQYTINYNMFKLRIRQIVALVIWIMNAYAIFLLVFGRFVIYLLYGEAYFPALSALRVLIWSYGLSYVGTIRTIWLICDEKPRYATIFSFVGCLSNVILNFFLIPIGGIIGASIATVFTQVLTSIVVPLLFKETRDFSILAIQGACLRKINLRELICYGKKYIGTKFRRV